MRNNTKLKNILKKDYVIGMSYNKETFLIELSLIDLSGKKGRKQFEGLTFSQVINKAAAEVFYNNPK